MQYDLFSCPFSMLNRMAQVTKLTMKSTRVRIEFTRESWKQFTQLNHSAIPAFVRAINIKADLALYIVAHEEQNMKARCTNIATNESIRSAPRITKCGLSGVMMTIPGSVALWRKCQNAVAL